MWLLGLVLLVSALPRVSIVVYPRIVQAGQQIRIECRVARHPANRRLEYGLVEWSVSFRDLAGEAAEVIWPTVAEAPCADDVTAYCFLRGTDDTFLAAQTVQVVCHQ